MARVKKALKRSFATVLQVLEDYYVGRTLRRMPSIVASDKREECKEKCNKECKEDYNRECTNGTSNECEEECEEKHNSFNKDQCKDKACSQPVRDEDHAARKAAPLARYWVCDKEENFPWMFYQLVCEESNWRGWWVLQVKDMKAMDWGVDVLPSQLKKGEKFVSRPTRQLPFPFEEESSSVLPSEGGQDEMMVWLGKS